MSDCDDKMCVGPQGAQIGIKQAVEKGGWSVIGVQGGPQPSFAYTVGLHSLALPELIMIGLRPDYATAIMNDCGQLMLDGGKGFEDGTIIEDVANLPLMAIKASDRNKRNYAFQANHFYGGWNFDMIQLVMPDKNGLWPWDEGFDPKMKGIQPILREVTH